MPQKDFLIDKITNSIEDRKSGKSYDTEVLAVNAEDVKMILKKNGWQFNWKKEFKAPGHSLYKLVIAGQQQIQGLISLLPLEIDRYIEMHLIESAPHNFGRNKQFLGVPANLVAFACKMSFERGFDGFVAFTAKTRLIDHHRQMLGAQLVLGNNRMVIFPMQAQFLVNSYYKK
jgi:hypothetical protein